MNDLTKEQLESITPEMIENFRYIKGETAKALQVLEIQDYVQVQLSNTNHMNIDSIALHEIMASILRSYNRNETK